MVCLINKIEHSTPLGKSDHDTILFTLSIGLPKTRNILPEPKYNFIRVDIIGFKNYLDKID